MCQLFVHQASKHLGGLGSTQGAQVVRFSSRNSQKPSAFSKLPRHVLHILMNALTYESFVN